jgi:hypothetical protein
MSIASDVAEMYYETSSQKQDTLPYLIGQNNIALAAIARCFFRPFDG